jgi:CheY-like chemotaxis protein
VNPKLLLADDSVTIQRVIELTFADEDVQVLAVGDGQQAIDRVRTERPDIVLADVGMPERDGYEVVAFIKGDPELAHIPVLLLTGAFEPIDEARARAVGCDGVLVKPFEPQMVISRVRDLLAGNRGPDSRAKVAHAAPAAVSSPADPAPSLEDYFDRLDAALASKSASAPPFDQGPAAPAPAYASRPAPAAAPSISTAIETGAPHADLDLSGWTPPASTPVEKPASAGAPPAPAPSVQSRPVSPPPQPVVAAPPAVPSASAPPAVVPATPIAAASPIAPFSLDQAFAALLAAEQGHAPAPDLRSSDTVTPGRLQADAVPEAVIDAVVSKVIARMGDDSMRAAVLDAAERLVREEIDRIKNVK